jgi:hypothetical protein
MLTEWMEEVTSLRQHLSRKETALPMKQLEDAVLSIYPFLKNPLDPDHPLPFTTLRKNVIPGSRGIVITSGRSHFRYALHLIASGMCWDPNFPSKSCTLEMMICQPIIEIYSRPCFAMSKHWIF